MEALKDSRNLIQIDQFAPAVPYQLCLYFLLHLSPFRQFEEGVGRVEEAGLEEEDKGNPLVVRFVLNLIWLSVKKLASTNAILTGSLSFWRVATPGWMVCLKLLGKVKVLMM